MTVKANRIRLSIIVASSGRPTLARTLDSAATQMLPGDELLVSVNDDAPWGHRARNELMTRARGDSLLFMDDDDEYADGALVAVRAALDIEPSRMHVFRMRYPNGDTIWRTPALICGNVSTQMVVVPNVPERRGWWGDRYEGDYDFIASTARLAGQPVWHEEVIALCRP
jgi:glycosyltransferase involved in cell wall biosynthesis